MSQERLRHRGAAVVAADKELSEVSSHTMRPFLGQAGDLGDADVHDSEMHHPRSEGQRSAVEEEI